MSVSALIEHELPDLIEIRHDLHRHPELGFDERRTSAVVQRELTRAGITFQAGFAKGTGVVAYLPASTPEGNTLPAVALRADMDALPIQEEERCAYASVNPGVMHACGHDGHTTILLGAARVLAQMPNRPRPVTFIFQPAEESGGGGELMCRDGALKGESGGGLGNPVGTIFGLHGWPLLPLGQVACKPGPMLASVDDFIVDIHGTGGHAAYPHLGQDPIVAAAHVVTSLQTIASRNVGPLDSVIVTVGQISAGTANNIIPQSCRIVGTVRTIRAGTRLLAKERFFALVEQVARAHGCHAHIDWLDSYPVTHNDPQWTQYFFRVARRTLGEHRVVEVEHPTMGGEDFSYYGQHIPSCFFFLGLRLPGEERTAALHQADFDFNDDALPTGIEMFVKLATEA